MTDQPGQQTMDGGQIPVTPRAAAVGVPMPGTPGPAVMTGPFAGLPSLSTGFGNPYIDTRAQSINLRSSVARMRCLIPGHLPSRATWL